MPLNLLDVALLVGFLVAGVRGARQGALSQVLTFGGAALGTLAGTALAPAVAAEFVAGPGPALSLTTLGIVLGFLVLGQAIGFAIGLRLRLKAEEAGHGGVDRSAGVIVGFGSLVVVVWLVGSALVQGPLPSLAEQIRGSTVVAAIDDVLPPPPDLFGRVGTFLDQRGFPQVFAGLGGATAPPVDPPTQGAVAAAANAGAGGAVQVQALGCGGISSGSGFAVAPGFVVTNAHVVAGGRDVTIQQLDGTDASGRVVLFDPRTDVAIVHAPGITAAPLQLNTTIQDRGTIGAALGFPGDKGGEFDPQPAAVQASYEATGRDIYGRSLVTREVYELRSNVRQGDSGGPFVLEDGSVAGVIFAASTTERNVGYALTGPEVADELQNGAPKTDPVGTGSCTR